MMLCRKKKRHTVSLEEWIKLDENGSPTGPKQFYKSYIKTKVNFGLEVSVKYTKLCEQLGSYVTNDITDTISDITDTISDIEEAYMHLEKYVGIQEVEIQTIMKFENNKYVKNYVIFNPLGTKNSLIRRSSSAMLASS
jgi:hypothetical protein